MKSYSLNPLDISDLLFHRSNDVTTNGTVIEGQEDNDITNCNEQLTYVGPISIVHHHASGSSTHRSTTNTTATTTTTSSSSKGRCLVATRQLDVGELLFITPPIVTANVQDIWDEYKERKTTTNIQRTTSLAEVAEYILIKACKDAISKQKQDVIRCLTALERRQRNSSDDSDGDHTHPNTCNIGRLLGQTDDGIEYDGDHEQVVRDNDDIIHSMNLSDEDILQIIRRNAFGADFPTIHRIEQRWSELLDNNIDEISNAESDMYMKILPSRLVGIYGLAAMINHSCIPNAVRVYSANQNCMIVHTCQSIQKGEEIVWSYIPLIQPYIERQLMLQTTHNFICQCPRCCSESIFLSTFGNVHEEIPALQSNERNNPIMHVVHRLEDEILNQSEISNEMKRYVRMSNMQSYMDYMNDTLLYIQVENITDNVKALQNLLTLAFQLHLAFIVCHNVSTEHLSILHLCYDLACMIHTKESAVISHDDHQSGKESVAIQQDPTTNTSKTIAAVRFWTEQLKRAIMIRYGSVGNNVNVVRQLLHHTKQVVRTENGFDHVLYKFI